MYTFCSTASQNDSYQWLLFESSFIKDIETGTNWTVAVDQCSTDVGFAYAVEKKGEQQFLKLHPKYPIKTLKEGTRLRVHAFPCQQCPLLGCIHYQVGTARVLHNDAIVFDGNNPLRQKNTIEKFDRYIQHIKFCSALACSAISGMCLYVSLNYKDIFAVGWVSFTLLGCRLINQWSFETKKNYSHEKRACFLVPAGWLGMGIASLIITGKPWSFNTDVMPINKHFFKHV